MESRNLHVRGLSVDLVALVASFAWDLDSASAAGHLQVVQLLLHLRRSSPVHMSYRALNAAAQNGFLTVVQALHESAAASCSTFAMNMAAANGHLDVVQFLHFHRSEGCTCYAMDAAAAKGHLDVVKFLHFHRTEGCTTAAMDLAAAQGFLEVVEFLHQNRTEGATVAAIDRAAHNGHLKVVQFCREARQEGCTQLATQWATANGHMEIVRYLQPTRGRRKTLGALLGDGRLLLPMTRSQVVPRSLPVILLFGFTLARVTERTLFLSTYSEDLNCTEIVYARIDNEVCTETSKCAIHNDGDGSFHDTEMTACILDRDEFLEAAFRGVPYLTVELYPTDCLGKSYNTRSFIADGKCHPYALSHFKVAQSNGTTAVWSSHVGCEDTKWYEEWLVVDKTQLNTEACVTDGKNYWKSYFMDGTATSWESSSDYEPITPAPTTTTAPPAVTQAPPVATPASSLAMPVSMVSTALCFVCFTLAGFTFV